MIAVKLLCNNKFIQAEAKRGEATCEFVQNASLLKTSTGIYQEMEIRSGLGKVTQNYT